jgi:hypothetical protein
MKDAKYAIVMASWLYHIVILILTIHNTLIGIDYIVIGILTCWQYYTNWKIVPLAKVKLPFQCNICHNKHHILYIVMDKTTKFTSHMCHEFQVCLFVCFFFFFVFVRLEKLCSFVELSYLITLFFKGHQSSPISLF